MPEEFKASATSVGVLNGGRGGGSGGPLLVMQHSRLPTTRSNCWYNGRTRSKRNSCPCRRTVLMTSRLRHRSPTKPSEGPSIVFALSSDTDRLHFDRRSVRP